MFRILIVFLTSVVAFAGKIEIPGGNKVTKAGVISVSVDWVKEKGDKFDIAAAVINEAKEAILISLADLHCQRGTRDGIVKFTGGSEVSIALAPGQLKRVNLVCELGESTRGHFHLVVGRVFANPSDDGKTKGKVLATQIEWMLSQWDAH